MDVIDELALRIPATLICELMGVPLADRARFTAWTARATHLLAATLGDPDWTTRATRAPRSPTTSER